MMVKKYIFSISYVLLALSLLSCASGKQNNPQDFKAAKIYSSVGCIADTNQTYSLFLPPDYSKEKPCPLLIVFDPHGDGLLPVTLFSSEASKSGFILAGSNISKNGMAIDKTTQVYRDLLTDLSSRFSIEKRAIYLCGFSGGSRVAAAAAITEGGVAGVVGCGAGMPNIQSKPVSAFSYLAVAGNQDFNLTEMQQLDESLEKANYQHHLLVFDGIHQWPPKETIADIFAWLRFDAMRQHAIPADRAMINSFIEQNDKTAGMLEAQGKLVNQQQLYIKMLHFLQGLTDVAPLQAEIDRLALNTQVVAYREQQKQLLNLEQSLQQKYSPEIQQKDIEWWKKETSHLRTLSEKPGNPEMNQVYKRLFGYLSLNCYMYSTNALKQGDLAAATKFIAIYQLVDPTNAEHRYMAAKVAALSHNPDEVFADLKQAFDLGFNDVKRLKSDADFQSYQKDERFNLLFAGK